MKKVLYCNLSESWTFYEVFTENESADRMIFGYGPPDLEKIRKNCINEDLSHTVIQQKLNE